MSPNLACTYLMIAGNYSRKYCELFFKKKEGMYITFPLLSKQHLRYVSSHGPILVKLLCPKRELLHLIDKHRKL